MYRETVTSSYRAYVTDSLMLRGENKYIPKRWMDAIEPPPPPQKEDPRPCAEIAADIWKRIAGE